MANWFTEISDLLDQTISVYSAGQTIQSDGSVAVSPVVRVSGVAASNQPLSGNEEMFVGKEVQDATNYFICLQVLPIQNGDIIEDQNGIEYRVTYFEDFNVAVGRYFAVLGRKLVQ